MVQKEGTYRVDIVDNKGCKAGDEIRVSFTDKPRLDLSKLDTLICGKYTTTVNIPADKPVTYSLTAFDPRVSIQGLTATVSPADYGTYPVTITAKDEFSCATSASFKLGFYKTPKVDFTIDVKKCSGYNLNARYVGDADTVVSNFKWVFGTDVIADTTGRSMQVVPLGVNRTQRDLSLTVTQDGCSNSFIQKDIKVIPNLTLAVDNALGCAPYNARFTATNTEVVVYDWDFGDGSPVVRQDSRPFHLYRDAGFYPVKLKITTVVTSGEGCTNEVTIDSLVHVAPIPTVGFTTLAAACLDKTDHQLSYTGSGDNLDHYMWDLSGLDAAEIIQNPAQTQGPLIFNLRNKPQTTIGLSVTSKYGCLSDTAKVLVKRKPAFAVSASSYAGCTPFNPLFKGTTGDPVDQVSYSWDFGDGTTGTGSQVSHSYATPDQKYDIVLSARSATTGCSDTIRSKSLMQTYPIPTAGFTPLAAACLDRGNHDISYAGTGDALDSYRWDLRGLDTGEVVQNPDTTQGPLIF